MMILTILSLVWEGLALVAAMFVLWRKLRSERVSEEDHVIDTAIVSLVVALLAGRLVFILFHIQEFSLDIGKWLGVWSNPGIVDAVVVVTFFKLFERRVRPWVRDSVEVADYVAIAASFYLFMHMSFELIRTVASTVQANMFPQDGIVPVLSLPTLIGATLAPIGYLGLFIFLSRVEKQYRTFLWYRSKRRSAETGFVIGCFLIGYGLMGFVHGLFLPKLIRFLGLGFDPFLRLLVMVGGFVLLYSRSGRTLFEKRS